MNAEISAFSSGDLNKYEFLTRKDLKYKPNALDKARFEFSSLGKAFRTRLDKTVQGYQEEGVIKFLKDIRDGLRGGNRRDGRNNNDDDNDDDNDDNDGDNDDDNDDGNDDDNDDDKIKEEKKYADMPDLETKEDAAKRIANYYDYLDKINKFKNSMENNMDNFDGKFKHEENKIYDKLNRLGNKIEKINNYIKENNDKKVDMENKLNVSKDQYNNLLSEYNQSKNELMETKNKLHKAGNNIDESGKIRENVRRPASLSAFQISCLVSVFCGSLLKGITEDTLIETIYNYMTKCLFINTIYVCLFIKKNKKLKKKQKKHLCKSNLIQMTSYL